MFLRTMKVNALKCGNTLRCVQLLFHIVKILIPVGKIGKKKTV